MRGGRGAAPRADWSGGGYITKRIVFPSPGLASGCGPRLARGPSIPAAHPGSREFGSLSLRSGPVRPVRLVAGPRCPVVRRLGARPGPPGTGRGGGRTSRHCDHTEYQGAGDLRYLPCGRAARREPLGFGQRVAGTVRPSRYEGRHWPRPPTGRRSSFEMICRRSTSGGERRILKMDRTFVRVFKGAASSGFFQQEKVRSGPPTPSPPPGSPRRRALPQRPSLAGPRAPTRSSSGRRWR